MDASSSVVVGMVELAGTVECGRDGSQEGGIMEMDGPYGQEYGSLFWTQCQSHHLVG